MNISPALLMLLVFLSMLAGVGINYLLLAMGHVGPMTYM
jgi:hypothetical protein